MSYIIDLSVQAKKDIEKHRKSGNKSVLKKIELILKELKENPYSGTGKVEKLKYELAGKLSRRINKEHRIVYSVNDNVVAVNVLSAYSHYENFKKR